MLGVVRVQMHVVDVIIYLNSDSTHALCHWFVQVVFNCTQTLCWVCPGVVRCMSLETRAHIPSF